MWKCFWSFCFSPLYCIWKLKTDSMRKTFWIRYFFKRHRQIFNSLCGYWIEVSPRKFLPEAAEARAVLQETGGDCCHFRTLLRVSFPCPSSLPQAQPGSSASLCRGELSQALHTSSAGPAKGSIFPALYATGCSVRCAGRRWCYSQVPCLRLHHSLYGGTQLSPLLHHQSQTPQSSCHSNPAGLKSHHESMHTKPPRPS